MTLVTGASRDLDGSDTVVAAPAGPYLPAMTKRRPPPAPEPEPGFVEALRRHGRVLDTDDADAPLPEGVTHVCVNGVLSEKRKSAF